MTMIFITDAPDVSLQQRYEHAFQEKYPTHRAKVKPAFNKAGFAGYRVFIDGETQDFGGLVINPAKMILALRDLLRKAL